MTEKKYIILTDIKEFTYKNALLTNQQIEEMLQEFDRIVMTWSEKYSISIIKSIWDAYLCLSDDIQNVYDFSHYIIWETKEYDATQKIEIKHIALRVVITFGDVTKNRAMNLDDYFGENINLASRIIDITPKGKIFCTQQIKENLKENIYSKSIWEHEFHGILYKTDIYSLVKMSNQEVKDLQSQDKSILEQCDTIVFRSACVSAVLSAQPIPFIENFNIVWVHLYMIIKISQSLEKSLNLRSSWEVFKEIISPIWAWYFGLQWTNTLAKIILPGIGWYLFSPLSFAMTYALWKVYTAYFLAKMNWETLSDHEIKDIFKKQKQVWKITAKKQKIDILKTGKKFYKDVLQIKDKTGYSQVQSDLHTLLKTKEK